MTLYTEKRRGEVKNRRSSFLFVEIASASCVPARKTKQAKKKKYNNNKRG